MQIAYGLHQHYRPSSPKRRAAFVVAFCVLSIGGVLANPAVTHLYQVQQVKKAFQREKSGAEEGNWSDQKRIGRSYFSGHYGIYNVDVNYEEAYFWTSLSCNTEHSLGHHSCDKTVEKIAKQLSSEQKILLEKRIQDWTPAENIKLTILQNKAAQGDLEAQVNLGDRLMYRQGKGGVLEREKAVEWYRKAAEQGYWPAQFKLGQLYSNGEVVTQDLAEAYFWFSLATINYKPTHHPQKTDIEKYNLNPTAEALSNEQKNAVDRRLKEWKPKLIEVIVPNPQAAERQ
jgi:TPR repeat protein